MAPYESWLKRMEHGSIGETRTKELLIDRFWILERSVDIQGADYIIQRRLTEKNILDFYPPRFGVVQAKFIQDENTSIYIDQEYIQDSNSSPRDEFFLIIHTGKEDSKRAFFLTANDIKNDFKLSEQQGSNSKKYRISGHLIKEQTYLVKSVKYMNDCIEQALIKAELLKNRLFIYQELNPLSPPDKSDIIDEFTVDIYNFYCDIPRIFFNLKSNAFRVLDNVERFASILRQMVNEKDPRKFMSLSEDLSYDVNGYGRIEFRVDDLSFDEDLFKVIVQHDLMFSKLTNVGKLDYFKKIKSGALEKLINTVSNEWNNYSNKSVLYFSIDFDPKTESEPIFILEIDNNINTIHYEQHRTISLDGIDSGNIPEISWLENQTDGRVKAGVYWKSVGNSYGHKDLNGQARSILDFLSSKLDEIIIEQLIK